VRIEMFKTISVMAQNMDAKKIYIPCINMEVSSENIVRQKNRRVERVIRV